MHRCDTGVSIAKTFRHCTFCHYFDRPPNQTLLKFSSVGTLVELRVKTPFELRRTTPEIALLLSLVVLLQWKIKMLGFL